MSLFLNVCVYSVPLSWIDIRIQLSHDLSFSFDSSVQKKTYKRQRSGIKMNYLLSADSPAALLHKSNVTLLQSSVRRIMDFLFVKKITRQAKWNISEIICIYFAHKFGKELMESGGKTWKVICPSHSTEAIRFVAGRFAPRLSYWNLGDISCVSQNLAAM